MNANRIVLCSVLLAASAVTACQHSKPTSDIVEEVEDGRALLVVRNNHFSSMDIYAVGGGLNSRLGTVSGGTTKQFAISESLTRAPELYIVGQPIGGNGRASTGSLKISSRQIIHFTIASVMSQSTVTIDSRP